MKGFFFLISSYFTLQECLATANKQKVSSGAFVEVIISSRVDIVSAQANLMELLVTSPAELGLYNAALKSFAFP